MDGSYDSHSIKRWIALNSSSPILLCCCIVHFFCSCMFACTCARIGSKILYMFMHHLECFLGHVGLVYLRQICTITSTSDTAHSIITVLVISLLTLCITIMVCFICSKLHLCSMHLGDSDIHST